MLDPRDASVIFTPPSRRNLLHPTVGALRIVSTAEADRFLDAPRNAGVSFFEVPVIGKTFAEQVAVVPEGETDWLRGAMLTAVRLITLDELSSTAVFHAFEHGISGWSEALPDGRWRDLQRMSGGTVRL